MSRYLEPFPSKVATVDLVFTEKPAMPRNDVNLQCTISDFRFCLFFRINLVFCRFHFLKFSELRHAKNDVALLFPAASGTTG